MVAILIAVALVGEVSQEQIAAYLERCELDRKVQIEAIEKLLTTKRRSRELNRKEKQKIVAEIEEQLAELKDRKHPHLLPLDIERPKMRSIGYVKHEIEVIEILNEDSAIIEACKTFYSARTGASFKGDPVTYLLRGIDTTVLVDGQEIDLSGVFAIPGNERAPGYGTIYQLELVELPASRP